MKKNSFWMTIKNELIYWILIVILSGFFMYLVNSQAPRNILIITGALNLVLLETWFVRIFFLFSGRKISQYSDVIQRILFKYFVF